MHSLAPIVHSVSFLSDYVLPIKTTHLFTSVATTPKYTSVGLTNGDIHILNADGKPHSFFTTLPVSTNITIPTSPPLSFTEKEKEEDANENRPIWAMDAWDQMLAAGSYDGDIHIWNLDTSIKRVNKDTLVTGSTDKTIRIWDLSAGTEIHNLQEHKGPVKHLAIQSNGKLISASSVTEPACVWNIKTGRLEFKLPGHLGYIIAIKIIDDHRVATSDSEGVIFIWNSDTGNLLGTLYDPEFSGPFSHLNLIGTNHLVGTGPGGSVLVWELNNYTFVKRTSPFDKGVMSMTVSDDLVILGGKYGYSPNHSCGVDNAIKIWRPLTSSEPETLIGPEGLMYSLSMVGKRLVAVFIKRVADVATVGIWDVKESSLQKDEL